MRIDSAAEFADYWRGVRKRTTRVIEQIRDEDLEWTYAPGRWTIGDIVRHLAGIERDMYLLLGMRGVKVPQIFGLTEEEVKARSVH